jgi:5-methylcytosine-specific restriction endonuclease McrA
MQNFAPGRSAKVAHASLLSAVKTMDQAKQNAVLWFGDILQRRLYLELGYSSINQYAQQSLGFSKTRTGDFLQMCKRLDRLPEVKKELADGRLGYTKAREITKVADEKNQDQWLDLARNKSRRELEKEVKRARQAAADQGKKQPSLLPEVPAQPAAVPPIRISFELNPEQLARYEALWEQLHKLGCASGDKVEVLLQALASYAAEKAPRGARVAAVSTNEINETDSAGARYAELDNTPNGGSEGAISRGHRPLFQIHIHQCPDCAKASITTSRGEQPISATDLERARCDARIIEPDKPAKSLIPPATRRLVLARDRHRCQMPGCNHTRFLEIHHIRPRARGGTHDPDNLITLCSACHRRAHQGDPIPELVREIPPRYRTNCPPAGQGAGFAISRTR